MYFQPVPVGLEPCPDFAVLVVGGVVLNQNGPLPAVSPCQLLEESQICGGVENRLLAIIEARAPQFDSAQNLDALALSGDGNFWRIPYAAPGGVERRILPEAGFVREDERPVSRAGFFLRLG